MRYLLICLLFLSCNQTQDKKQQTANFNETNKKDSLPYTNPDTLKVDTFDITSLIPEFSKDTNFQNISGIQVGTDIQKIVFYSIYRLPKRNLFEALKSKSEDTKLKGKKKLSAYSDLVKIETNYFFKMVYREYENNPTAHNFYDKLKSLKGYDIFFASTYGYIHWLFFDKNSDTVYQRTQFLTF